MFRSNKLKNERSILDQVGSFESSHISSDQQLKARLFQENSLRELSRGKEPGEEINLQEALKRRQLAKILIKERKRKLVELVDDLDNNYAANQFGARRF